ncbi:MAG: hypothetical protein HY706_06580 [Candidatus Hydrogenedentes bacterium]|nr:hypothetical protein [Candidatus Hydrogenedentota bacterium]
MLDLIRNHKILTTLFILIILFAGCLGYRMKGPYRSYRLDVIKPAPGESVTPGTLEVGVAKRDITPDMSKYDTWSDVDGDFHYRPDRGDTYQDLNKNGKFDAVWLAGFHSDRPAQGVNDPLWVRAIAFRNNGVTIAMATIDGIGIFHEKFIKVRKMIDPSLKIDHVMFSSLHDHEAPDTMGLWSYSPFRPQFDYDYMALVQRACKEAVEEAVRNLQPVEMYGVEAPVDPEKFVRDTRQPIVYDKRLCLARFVKPGTDETVATMMSWGNHAEATGSKNLMVSSDFSHPWRLGVETGVPEPNGVKGLGGMCLYFQGMVGGLMTPLHLKVVHRNGKDVLEEDSFDKAAALGDNLAIFTVNALRSDKVWKVENPRVAFAAKTIYVPMARHFKYAIMLGLIHPGYFWGKARTEVNVFRIGELEILTLPGELYPEIGEGGIETPDGADFPVEPVEVPALRSQMKGKMNMIIGLANDEIGYIIPKSQWDVKPPYAYGRTDEPQYGEENSGGPDVAPTIHREALALLDRAHAAWNLPGP